MPHQCLQCGHAFEEGSSALLAGCPQCKGTRFFYTAKAVDEGERKRIAEKAQKDLRHVVAEMLRASAPETADEIQSEDGWADLKARDLRRLVKQVQAKKASEADEVGADVTAAAAERKRIEKEIQARREEDAKPDTVTVHDVGEYEIDVKGLLERNPIVVHRDGAYMIHLPSLFDGKE